MSQITLTEIPTPPGEFLLGNMNALKSGRSTMEALTRLGLQHRPIFQWREPMARVLVASGFEVIDELCDEARFDKSVQLDMEVAREIAGDGLFTARTDEPNWGRAHNILLPCFSRDAILQYMPQMEEILRQMIAKWDRAADSGAPVDVPEDFTAMSLDTIGLCGFDYRFDSFGRTEPDPMVEALGSALGEISDYLERPAIVDRLMPRKRRLADRERMYAWIDDLVARRRKQGGQATDLLSYMLSGVDRKTGESLDDTNIRYQIVTFLFAGHDTTSTLLSCAMYALVKNPVVLARALEEVDAIMGGDLERRFIPADLPRFEYIPRVLRETLRLWPPAGLLQFAAREDTVVAGKYALRKGEPVIAVTPCLHRDPAVWGAHADEFDPDRFLPEAEQARPANAYKPFGNGQRSCIGRQFALQEAVMALALVLQRYRPVDYADYQLKMIDPLTNKPEDFRIKLERRTDADRRIVHAPASAPQNGEAAAADVAVMAAHHTGMLVLYGSDMSASEGLARRLGHEGLRLGFDAVVAPLDDYVDRLPKDGVVAIVTSTYNGRPPDNAANFYAWLNTLAPDSLKGLRYFVFGCGNREWASTYQAIPRAIDERLAACGAVRLVDRGEADAARDFDGDFDRWQRALWPALAAQLGLVFSAGNNGRRARFEVEVLTDTHPNPFVPAFKALPMTVIENRELHARDGAHPSDRSTRHIEIALPDGVTYQTGDHLGVIARNGTNAIARVAAHFGLSPESRVRVKKLDNEKTVLPLDQIISVGSLLSDYLDLNEVASRRHIATLLEHTRCPRTKQLLSAFTGEDDDALARYKKEVLGRRKSVIDLLDENPAIEVPFHVYLEMLSPLRPRYYSISSSALASPRIVSLTVGVVDGPAHSGRGRYEGICSTHLGRQRKGDLVHAFVREANATFRLPKSPTTPVVMIGPGTGVAPFRGFLHERESLRERGRTLGPAYLFFGCRHRDMDFIYREEMERFAAAGIVDLQVACSRQGDQKVYVQDLIRARGAELWKLFEDGAHVYICGDGSHMAPAVRQAFCELYQAQTGNDAAAAEQWMTDLMAQERYLLDVWTS